MNGISLIATMLCDVVVVGSRAHAPVIHAASHVDHKKEFHGFIFLCVHMVLPFSTLRGRRSSANNMCTSTAIPHLFEERGRMYTGHNYGWRLLSCPVFGCTRRLRDEPKERPCGRPHANLSCDSYDQIVTDLEMLTSRERSKL